jgi:hypothetical protein
MSTIRLQDMKVIYICPAHNEKYMKRKEYMELFLKQNGFENVTHYKSSAEAYPKCLSLATIDILESHLDEPFLLLEDDVETTGQFSIEIPADADAIYLGLSKSAGSPSINMHDGASKFEAYSVTQARVMNMLATHAVLYLTRSYKEAVVKILREHLNTEYYNDVLISRIQKHHRVYANKIPVFWQSKLFNIPHLEYATKIKLVEEKGRIKIDRFM